MIDRSVSIILADIYEIEVYATIESDDRATIEIERVRVSSYLTRAGALKAEAKRARALADTAVRAAKDDLEHVHSLLYLRTLADLTTEDPKTGKVKPPPAPVIEATVIQDGRWIVARDHLRDLELAEVEARHAEERAWSCWEAMRCKMAMLASLAADFRAELMDPSNRREARESREEREMGNYPGGDQEFSLEIQQPTHEQR